MHEAADGEVGQQEAVDLLTHKLRGLAAKDDLGAAQVGLKLDFIEFWLGWRLYRLMWNMVSFRNISSARSRVSLRGPNPPKVRQRSCMSDQ